jgi:cellulose synthase/poly-beta-1,6-N-acetylglucosamine synthase-like glycosyltransferase
MAISGVMVLCMVLTAIMLIYGAYYVVFGLIGLFHPYHSFKHSKINHHFTVLIPARNEESVIGELVDSLKKQNYPKNAYTINVIADHCTDRTAEIAGEHGATVIINRPIPIPRASF